jgi:hypothetical protein
MSVQIVKLLDTPVQLNFGNIVPMGVYNSATTYSVGNSVSYGTDSYIAIQTTTGNLPTNTAYWQLLAAGAAVTVSSPLTLSGGNIALPVGNITDSGSDGITITGGTGAVVGTGVTVAQAQSSATQNGYLASADWNTFNNKASTDTALAYALIFG